MQVLLRRLALVGFVLAAIVATHPLAFLPAWPVLACLSLAAWVAAE